VWRRIWNRRGGAAGGKEIVHPQRPPTFEQLEPRLLLSADLTGIEPVLLPETTVSEHAIFVDFDQEQANLPESLLTITADSTEPVQPEEVDESQVDLKDGSSDGPEPLGDAARPAELGASLAADVGIQKTVLGASLGQVACVVQAESPSSGTCSQEESADPVVADQQDVIAASEASSIEIRGPPQVDSDSVSSSSEAFYSNNQQSSISGEGECLPATGGAVAPDLPGLYLVDPDPSNLQGQVIYLDFDGAEEVTYNGPVTVGPFDVPAFQAPGELAGQEQTIIDQILSNLQEIFARSGVIFTTHQPPGATQYSTIYIGGDDSAFLSFGQFYGLAENLDIANRDRSDEALVFAEEIPGGAPTPDEYCAGAAQLVAHEAGRLLGYAEASEEVVAGQEITLAEVDLAKDHVKVNGVMSSDNSGSFYVQTGAYVWFEAQFTHWWGGDHGGINMSFPYFDGTYSSRSWTGDNGSDEYYPGVDDIYPKGATTPVKASHLMVEGYESWWGNYLGYETHTLKTRLLMRSSYDYFRFRTRAWVGSTFVPSSGPNDQQNYDCYEFSVYADGEGPYAPGNVDVTPNATYDTGKSQTDNITKNSNPQFQWTKPSDRGGAGTKDYYYWTVTQQGSSTKLVDGNTTATSVKPGSLSDGNYTFWVCAQDNSGNWGEWGSCSFTIDTQAPLPPTFSSPSEWQSITDTTPTLDWQSVSGAWKYQVFVREHNAPWLDSRTSTELTSSQWTVPSSEALGEKAWGWQVRVCDVAGNWGDYGRNSVDGGWGHFSVQLPHVIDLRWETAGGSLATTAEGGSTVYAEVTGVGLSGTIQLEIWEDDDLGGLWNTGKVISVPVSYGGGRTSWTADWDPDSAYGIVNLDSDPEYVLRYIPDDITSGELKVIDTTGPTIPELSLPSAGGIITTGRVDLFWQLSTDPYGSGLKEYVVQVDTDSNFSDPQLYHTEETSLSLALNSGTYYWKVVGLDQLLNQSDSQVRSFVVDLPDVFEYAKDVVTTTPTYKPLFYVEAGFGLSIFEFTLVSVGMSITVDLSDMIDLPGGNHATLDGKQGYTTVWTHGNVKALGAEIGIIDLLTDVASGGATLFADVHVSFGIMGYPVSSMNEDPSLSGAGWWNAHWVVGSSSVTDHGLEVMPDFSETLLDAHFFEYTWDLWRWEVPTSYVSTAFQMAMQAVSPATAFIGAFFNPTLFETLGEAVDDFTAGTPVLPFTADGGAIPDNGPPTAALISVDEPEGTDLELRISYEDTDSWIDASDIDDNDVVVSGPGYSQAAELVGMSSPSDISLITATYRINAPGSTWDYDDNGTYTIHMQPNQVSDTAYPPNYVLAGALGTFDVNINTSPEINGLPDRGLNEDTDLDNTIDLWAYTSDNEMSDSELIFSIAGNTNFNSGVSIDGNRYIDINPSANWYGTSYVTIQVSDGSLNDTDTFTITVTSVNDVPIIASLSDSPDPVVQGQNLTLTANSVSDDHGVASVSFYRDDNTNGIGDPGELLGTDSSSSGGWSWSGAATWAPGTYTYLAQATDDGVPAPVMTSAWVSATGQVTVVSDFGDAPAPYATTLAEGGARHAMTGPTLGDERDSETDGSHSPAADADDTTGTPDDEDGVTFGTIRVGQLDAMVTVNVQNNSGTAYLDAWIDFNADGSWGGALEQIAAHYTLVGNGDHVVHFDVPSWAISGETFARFRLSTTGQLAPGGLALDGEVEDYIVSVATEGAVSVGALNNGIAAQDGATGTGYIMYSEESVHSRFSASPPFRGTSDHLIAVKYISGQWYYDNNATYVAFTPVATDLLLFEVDFSGDTVTDLKGTWLVVNGVESGYADGDLVVTANMYLGSPNPGEFGLSGSWFVGN